MDSLTEAWINDYLDLYNYARSIGDSEWEAAILESLHNKDIRLQEYKKSLLLHNLWRAYETINQQLMEIFAELRAAEDRSRTESLQEVWHKLKLKRIDVARKILAVK